METLRTDDTLIPLRTGVALEARVALETGVALRTNDTLVALRTGVALETAVALRTSDALGALRTSHALIALCSSRANSSTCSEQTPCSWIKDRIGIAVVHEGDEGRALVSDSVAHYERLNGVPVAEEGDRSALGTGHTLRTLKTLNPLSPSNALGPL